jgi:geranylgeranyl pyrophosphate synthase
VTFEDLLGREQEAVESALRELFPVAGEWPDRLWKAMEYAVFAGGKRIRPVLARLAHRAAGGDADEITRAACGLELIHTYSLVHDDLPALDDDILRRGRPTVHVAFDEATAVLVGDALLTEGLLILARHPGGEERAGRRAEAVATVGDDLEAKLDRIHRHKTGCLLRASVELGAILAGVDGRRRTHFCDFGEDLGLAFQVADDILDTTADAADLGKSPGKDEAAGKLTYVTLYGLDQAQRRLDELEQQLVERAGAIEGPDGELAALARFVCRRKS